MKILLINPPSHPTLSGVAQFVISDFYMEPLALEVLAGALPEHSVRILDLKLDDDLAGALREFAPDVVGVTCGFSSGVYIVQQLCRRIKRLAPSVFTVVGGHHPTLMPEDFNLPAIDAVVIGTGWDTFRELIDAIAAGSSLQNVAGLAIPARDRMSFTAVRPAPVDLDQMPLPRRDLVARYRKHYFLIPGWQPVYLIASEIGCPFRCSFCSVHKALQGRYLTRSAESLVRELRQLPGRDIFFADPHTLTDVPRAEALYHELKKHRLGQRYAVNSRADVIARHPEIIERWVTLGLDIVALGLESFRDRELASLNKKSSQQINEDAIRVLRKCGITILPSFIVRPDYTQDDFDQLAAYVDEWDFTYPMFMVLTPLPGTDLHRETTGDILTRNYELYDVFHSVLPTRMDPEAFAAAFFKLYRRAYGLTRHLKRFGRRCFRRSAGELARERLLSPKEVLFMQFLLSVRMPAIRKRWLRGYDYQPPTAAEAWAQTGTRHRSAATSLAPGPGADRPELPHGHRPERLVTKEAKLS
jgi:radical SAM superfamily enzyme YgiQ (UPF0313 family)